ncbi:hypothetical protein [Planococcus sp. ISL-109]|uniref:hypothetical protein n=1 Tax=Planococcus sp. ISL-109 TaxID=2819166 RepID=UPI001BEB513D|nr:hypothetical protein [Planococcus sp. ISL-109]
MIETNSLALTAEKVIEFMGTEVELNAEFWQLKKKRMIDVHRSLDMCVCWSLDLTVSFRIFRDDRKVVNEAEVFLLPEELPIFTQALIQHPILFPISYSQHLSMERGMYCLRLKSQEPFEDFAERLSEALCRLG